jgi:pantoate--beta-alanine ligase
MKDFQQIAVIKDLVRQYNYNVKIVGNPIIRESNGLAMSSRNRLLEPEMRKKVPLIYKTISSASGMIHKNTISEIKNYVRGTIDKANGLHVEYFEIVDDTKLVPVNTRREMKKGYRYYGCIAVQAGTIRLIDNIEFPLV